MDRKQVEAYVDKLVVLTRSPEFLKAERLMKLVTKYKDDVKKFCHENNIHSIETENGKVEFKLRSQMYLNKHKIDPDIVENAMDVRDVWLAYYEPKQ
jgi:hypothetical protein